MRLARYLAHCGVASRRRAEELIAAGRVSVGGETVTDPARDVDESSGVEVNGRPVAPEPREVWMVNKPAGVVSTAREPGRRQAVVELVDSKRRLYPVGRLDADSTGLILLTNDGELANRLTHPRYGVKRSYRVRLRRPASEPQLRRLRRGVELDDGPTAPAGVRRVSPRVLEVTIARGPQPAGAADDRGGRQRGRRAGPDSLRLDRPGRAARGQRPGGSAARRSQRLWKDARAVEKAR